MELVRSEADLLAVAGGNEMLAYHHELALHAFVFDYAYVVHEGGHAVIYAKFGSSDPDNQCSVRLCLERGPTGEWVRYRIADAR
jgi:hypothetical protein